MNTLSRPTVISSSCNKRLPLKYPYSQTALKTGTFRLERAWKSTLGEQAGKPAGTQTRTRNLKLVPQTLAIFSLLSPSLLSPPPAPEALSLHAGADQIKR